MSSRGGTTEASSLVSEMKSPSRGHFGTQMEAGTYSFLRALAEQKGQQEDNFNTKRD